MSDTEQTISPVKTHTMSRQHGLSKSRYVAGLQCHKQLWWRVHEPKAPELVPDADLQSVFDTGARCRRAE